MPTAPDSPAFPRAAWHIGVDVGGTFTDMVLADGLGRTRVYKVLSVAADPGAGVLDALKAAAEDCALTVDDLLSGCGLFVHGSTVATNTLLEETGATVGLLATEGFRDSLEIRRGFRHDQWDHRRPFPRVLVPRHLRIGVAGRIAADGSEEQPLSVADVEAAIETFRQGGVDSIAICLINSFVEPAHEIAAAETVGRAWDGDWVSVSSDIVPVMGEYERTSTTVVNAYLAAQVVAYLRTLNEGLMGQGLKRPMLLVQSNGGMVSIDNIADAPVNLVLSGPAAGVGAMNLFRRAAGSDDLISMDIGGTSCDVTLMSGGAVHVTDALVISGYHLAVPSVEIHTLGAGGGTIAGVDSGGMLFVGPQGAGARPGPACYGFGGEAPTVTDAQLVLGRLRPGPYAGGSVSLDKGRAVAAVEARVAEPLGLDVETAAAGIVRLLEQNLLHAVESLSIERGHDARRFTIVAAGGAGPMHGARVARTLGCRRVYVPRQAGAFCAIGMLHSDVRQDYLKVFLAPLDGVDADVLAAHFADLEERAARALTTEGFGPSERRIERQMDLRYPGQQWAVRVAVDADFDGARVRRDFEAEHDRLFGHIQPDGIIEITDLRVAARGLIPPLEVKAKAPTMGVPEARDLRPVYIDDAVGWVDTPIFSGDDLGSEVELAGPLLIEEQTTTLFAGSGDVVRVDETGNYVIEIADGR